MSVWKVTVWSHLLGAPIFILGAVLIAAPGATPTDLAWGVFGGLFGLGGLAIMYATLAAGTMSIVAPVIGAGAAILPVIWAVSTGESITSFEWVGIAIAGAAVALLASQPGAGRLNRKLLLQALAAACGFAIFIIAFGQTDEASGLWPLVAARAVTIPVALTVILVRNIRPVAPKGSWRLAVTTGVLDAAGNVAIVLAVQRGPLGINAVLGSLYPLFTVAAAIIVIREHPSSRQIAGILMAGASILMLAM